MAEPATIQCPWCKFELKPWATVCAGCGMDLKRWVEVHPDRPIAGWTPGQRPEPTPAPPPEPKPTEPAAPAAPQAPLSEEELRLKRTRNGGTALFALSILAGIVLVLLMIFAENPPWTDMIAGAFLSLGVFAVLGAGAYFLKWRACVWLGMAYLALDIVLTLVEMGASGQFNPGGIIMKLYFIFVLWKTTTTD